jgi:hypothetical protein
MPSGGVTGAEPGMAMHRRDSPEGRGIRLLLLLARPYLRLHLLLYARAMSTATFPLDDRDRTVLGPDPHRVLFLGDIGVAGYGVLLPGMAMPAQATARLAAATHRGCTYTTVFAPDMTAEKALGSVRDRAARIDVAVLALGFPDALMMTSPGTWQRRMSDIVESVRAQAGAPCVIVLAGIPPVERFRSIPPAARALLRWQVRRLNAATEEMHDPGSRVVWAPFPAFGPEPPLVDRGFSFRTMHARWAVAISPHLVRP